MLSDKDVQHIAALARIQLSEKEQEKFKKDLSSILDYIETLKKVDTDQIEPLYQTTGLINATRPDEPRGEFTMDPKLQELLVGQAPDKKDRSIRVRSVLKK